ncbi:MAG: nitrile hydratase subunit beta [Mycobacterium sp.]
MNGVHDMGGLMPFGPVFEEPDEPVFHADWERRVLGINVAMGATGSWTGDAGRHARESIPPAQYLSSSYYEIWLAGLEKLTRQCGLVTADELEGGRSLAPPKAVQRVLHRDEVKPLLDTGAPSNREATTPAQFAVGDTVVTRNINPVGHTRLPRYARSKRGVVERIHGVHVLPDANAHGLGESPQWLYTVRFTATELWGEDADAHVTASIDAWEGYLESD